MRGCAPGPLAGAVARSALERDRPPRGAPYREGASASPGIVARSALERGRPPGAAPYREGASASPGIVARSALERDRPPGAAPYREGASASPEGVARSASGRGRPPGAAPYCEGASDLSAEVAAGGSAARAGLLDAGRRPAREDAEERCSSPWGSRRGNAGRSGRVSAKVGNAASSSAKRGPSGRGGNLLGVKSPLSKGNACLRRRWSAGRSWSSDALTEVAPAPAARAPPPWADGMRPRD